MTASYEELVKSGKKLEKVMHLSKKCEKVVKSASYENI